MSEKIHSYMNRPQSDPIHFPSWNLLPTETAEATSVDAFKHRLP